MKRTSRKDKYLFHLNEILKDISPEAKKFRNRCIKHNISIRKAG